MSMSLTGGCRNAQPIRIKLKQAFESKLNNLLDRINIVTYAGCVSVVLDIVSF